MLGKNCFWADEITIQKKQTNKKTTTKIDPNADTLLICIQKQGCMCVPDRKNTP